MSALRSRRLRYLAGVVGIIWLLLALLRLVFFLGFSPFSASQLWAQNELLNTLAIGLRFDLRLAILLMLPLALLAYLPRWNLISLGALRLVARGYLAIALLALLLLYILDFGHYAYLGLRINATVLGFAKDAGTSATMVWQTYPVLWIATGWLATAGATFYLLVRWEQATLQRPATPQSKWSIAGVTTLAVVAVLLGLLARVDNLNLENPVPLRWSDAFYSGNDKIAALGLNPVLFLYDTLKVKPVDFDEQQARSSYELMAHYLGVTQPDRETLNYVRHQAGQPSAEGRQRPPNVMFIMLESLGTSAVGAYGNPLNPTPNLDRLAKDSWFFRHFYVPVTGTAKTVWASITGVPDVSRQQTATRNPLITRQHSLINAFTGYEKLYLIGGNAGWANINALIRQSVDGVKLYEEGHWQSPLVDVWGISDLDLFKETDQLLQALPNDQPFFAYLQTSGNHRPFTIPANNDGFQALDLPLEQVQRAGSRSVAQYNAVRLLDFNIGRLFELAKAGGYYDNTIFVLFGDHNTRISQIPHMPPAFEQLGLESNNVPLLIHAPGLLEPQVFDEAVGLADLLPTVAGLVGVPYRNGGLGRDIRQPAPEGERVVPLVLQEGSFPVIGGVSRNFLLQMQHDGSSPTLHDIRSAAPSENVATQHPQEYQRLLALTRALHETARVMLYNNVRP